MLNILTLNAKEVFNFVQNLLVFNKIEQCKLMNK